MQCCLSSVQLVLRLEGAARTAASGRAWRWRSRRTLPAGASPGGKAPRPEWEGFELSPGFSLFPQIAAGLAMIAAREQ
eukprot:1184330-Prymnesium_polylepis.1